MRKFNKLILVILIILIAVTATSAFVACKKKDAPPTTPSGPSGEPTPDSAISLTFVSNNEQIATKIDIDKAKEILASQPTREGYVFKGWYLDNGTWKQEVTSANVEEVVKENVKVYAYWIEIVKKITVRFLDYTGAELLKKDYERSDDQLDKDLASLCPSNYEDQQYTYTFKNWNCDVSDETQENFVATPVYTSELRVFEVNYYVEGKLHYTDHVQYGADADVSKVEEPMTWYDDLFKHEFQGWVGNLENVTQNTMVYAQFNEIYVTRYTVQFVNWEGSVLETVKVESGQPVVYSGETPTREQNEMYTYEFAGWTTSNEDADLENVTCNFVATANYNEEIRTYTITFTDDDDNVIKELTSVPYGTDLRTSSTFSIPSNDDAFMESTPKYDYTFIDWNQYLSRVYSDMTVKGIYKKTIRRYIVQFINNGSVISTQEVEYDQYPTIPAIFNGVKNDTVKWDFNFFGWQVLDVDTTQAGGEDDIDAEDGTDYRYTVTSTEGMEALDPENSIVHGAITYTAVYSRTLQQYIVSFLSEEGENGIDLGSITVDYGTNVIENLLAPEATKESNAEFNYFFTNWSQDLTYINRNIQVYAVYNAVTREYTIKFINNGEVYEEVVLKYGSTPTAPEVDPTKASTLEFDYVFTGWDGMLRVVGDMDVIAQYRGDIRSYLVTLFNLSTYEEISSNTLAYGSEIKSSINVPGYDFDSWYRDPDCNTAFNKDVERVDGPMMLFGNIVMQGLQFNENNEITGYQGIEGSEINLIIPIAANGRKVSIIKEKAFENNTAFGSVYIPNTITKVEKYAFKGVDIAETGRIYVQSEKGKFGIVSTSKPDGWDTYWNHDSVGQDSNIVTGSFPNYNRYDRRPVTFGVNGIYSIGDYQYMLFSDSDGTIDKPNTAYIDKFINNTTSRAYIDDTFVHEKPSFTSTKWIDEGKTEEERDIYTTQYTETTYKATQISVSAFEGSKNLTTIFIPSTIEKISNYAFSGVSANIYIARSIPTGRTETNVWSLTGTSKWNKNRDGQEGDRTLYWDVIALDTVGDFNYIFKTGNVAIAAEYLGSTAATSVEVPGVITYKEEKYIVEEVGAELLTNMSLLSTVTIGEGVTKIGKKAFYMDVMLNTVNLPSTLTEISEQAFMACMRLSEIYIPEKVSKVGSLAFIGIDNLTIYCGKSSKPLTGYAIGWNTKLGFSDLGNMTDISGILGSVTQTHEVIWGVAGLPQVQKQGSALPGEYTYLLYTDGHAELIASNIPAGSLNTSYSIPEKLTQSYEYLDENKEIQTGTKDYAVTTIRATAFAGNTRIKELIIPTSVTTIEAGAFQGCSNLTIKTAHTTKPSGWDSAFNANGDGVVPVQWSYGTTTASSTESATENTEAVAATVSETAEAKKDETEEAA